MKIYKYIYKNGLITIESYNIALTKENNFVIIDASLFNTLIEFESLDKVIKSTLDNDVYVMWSLHNDYTKKRYFKKIIANHKKKIMAIYGEKITQLQQEIDELIKENK